MLEQPKKANNQLSLRNPDLSGELKANGCQALWTKYYQLLTTNYEPKTMDYRPLIVD